MVMMLHVLILGCFFLPIIFKKIKNFMLLIFLGFQFIFFSLYELVAENKGLSGGLDKLKEYAEGYLMASTRLFVFTFLFTKLVGKGLLSTAVFIILGLIIYQITPDNVRRMIADTKNKLYVAGKYWNNH